MKSESQNKKKRKFGTSPVDLLFIGLLGHISHVLIVTVESLMHKNIILGCENCDRIDLAQKCFICAVISLARYLHCDVIEAPSGATCVCLLFLISKLY